MKYLISFFILGAVIAAVCPWLKKEEAQMILNAKVVQMVANNPDLCELTIYPETLHKVAFGFAEDVSFDCTVTDDVYGVKQSRDTVLVTFYKGILGMPTPVVRRSP